jgi:hypothetical protein
MGRNIKIILGAGVVLAVVLLIVSSSGRKSDGTGYIPPANVFEIKDFELLTGYDGGDYRLTAAEAKYNRKTNNAEMNSVKVEGSEDGKDIYATADKGYLDKDRFVRAEGNLAGKVGDITFGTAAEGVLKYDMKESSGFIENDVVYRQGTNIIKSDRTLIDIKNGVTRFLDNVSVSYSM